MSYFIFQCGNFQRQQWEYYVPTSWVPYRKHHQVYVMRSFPLCGVILFHPNKLSRTRSPAVTDRQLLPTASWYRPKTKGKNGTLVVMLTQWAATAQKGERKNRVPWLSGVRVRYRIKVVFNINANPLYTTVRVITVRVISNTDTITLSNRCIAAQVNRACDKRFHSRHYCAYGGQPAPLHRHHYRGNPTAASLTTWYITCDI